MTGNSKILLVSNGFYPEISPRSYRATELTKEFFRQGHEVTVISKFRDHDYSDFLKEFPVTFKMWNKPVFHKVPDFKQKPFSFFSRGISRFLSLLFEYPGIEEMFLVKKMLKHENTYDLMISFAVPYPVQWGVAWSRSEKHPIAGIWVADCGDPYMGDVLDSFRKPFYFRYLEKWFCRKADFISIPVESARPGYYPEFHHKIRIIPQGFEFDLILKQGKQHINSIPEFAYAGRFLHGIRDPGLLMQFLTKIDLPFKFYVFTDQPDLINEYREALYGRLIVSEYINRSELITRLSKMDFLINFDNNTPLNVPSKLIDYAIINRPVLNIDRNFSIEDLLAFLNKDYRKRMVLPDRQQYHIKSVSQLFLDLLKTNLS
jgi:hypothetical protein